MLRAYRHFWRYAKGAVREALPIPVRSEILPYRAVYVRMTGAIVHAEVVDFLQDLSIRVVQVRIALSRSRCSGRVPATP